MHLTKEQVEQTRIILVGESDGISFYPEGKKSDGGYWYLTEKTINESGPQDDQGNSEFYEGRSLDSFLKFVNANEVVAEVAVYENGRYEGKDEVFKDWDHLAKYLGVSDMIAVSTKLPKSVADKFRFYSTRGSSNPSETLRKLVYDYVKQQIIDNAERDMFR